jgi:hypothetical protein
MCRGKPGRSARMCQELAGRPCPISGRVPPEPSLGRGGHRDNRRGRTMCPRTSTVLRIRASLRFPARLGQESLASGTRIGPSSRAVLLQPLAHTICDRRFLRHSQSTVLDSSAACCSSSEIDSSSISSGDLKLMCLRYLLPPLNRCFESSSKAPAAKESCTCSLYENTPQNCLSFSAGYSVYSVPPYLETVSAPGTARRIRSCRAPTNARS